MKLLTAILTMCMLLSGCVITSQFTKEEQEKLLTFLKEYEGNKIEDNNPVVTVDPENSLPVPDEVKTVTVEKAKPAEINPVEKPVNDLDFVTKWKSTSDVKDWPITTNLTYKVSGNKIWLYYDKSDVWPNAKAVGLMLNANVWAILKDGDTYLACTWEWIPKKQTIIKELDRIPNAFREHFKKEYDPKVNKCWIFVAGLSRNNVRNVKERSQIVGLELK